MKTATPENDKFTDLMNGVDDATHLVALDLLSRDLEERLAITVKTLRYVYDHHHEGVGEFHSKIAAAIKIGIGK